MTRVPLLIKPRGSTRQATEPAQKSLIVTADDFGFSRAVNAGIIRAHREGVLTATSLMVTGAARDEAARLAREHSALDVGLHLVVCRGRAVLERQHLAGIVDAQNEFAENPTLAGMRYFFNRQVQSMLRDEIRAQIELHLALIGQLNHLDGHLNFHVHPAIAAILVEMIEEYGIRSIRLPREAVFTTLALARNNAPRKLVEAVIFRTLSRRARRLFASKGVQSSNWLFGLHQSGHLTEAYVAGVIARLPPGLTEFYFHPAESEGEEASSAAARREVAILTSSRIREALTLGGITLTNFAEVSPPSERQRGRQ
jgi:hopanoid biosynthesis associated protein HpnK